MHQDSQSDQVESKVEALGEILPRLLATYGMDDEFANADRENGDEFANADRENGIETERGPLVGAPA